MIKNEHEALNIAALSGWTSLMFISYALIGIDWFHLGDFSFKTAMAYHGILIPAWMMLALAYSRHIEYSNFIKKLVGIGAVFGSVLTGIGSALIHKQGFSLGTFIQVVGLILAEITAFVIIIESFYYYFKVGQSEINAAAWWTTSIALISLSLATALGHLAGVVKDFGMKSPLFFKHTAF